MNQRILIFRVGQLGDTLAALPALWAVREHFRDARLTLLSDLIRRERFVPMKEVIDRTGLIDDFEFHVKDAPDAAKLPLVWRTIKLLARLRARRFDGLVYLAPTRRWRELRERDLRFFRLAGIRRVYGIEGFVDPPQKRPGEPLPAMAHEADQLLHRLRLSGIPTPPPGEGRMDLNLTDEDDAEVNAWLATLGPASGSGGGRRWIGVGPGSKMPAKIWPEERFAEVVQALIDRFDVWPVVFGGREDAATGQRLIERWKRGHNAAGALGIRAAAAALRSCDLYLGNDTGTMHLATTAGIPCVAVFSSREAPGLWDPYGSQHHVFRTDIECEGCQLIDCVERGKECIMRITADEVGRACEAVLQRCREGVG